jgi:hypothetical protein
MPMARKSPEAPGLAQESGTKVVLGRPLFIPLIHWERKNLKTASI